MHPIPRTQAFERHTDMSQYRNQVVTLASISLGLLIATQARAGTYQKVNQSDWWQGVTGLPSYVNMYIFLPTTMATKPPIVVGVHHCQGTASSTHSEMASLETISDKNGFIMIYPEATGENCWDAGSIRSLKHGGGGDTGAVVQMVKYTLSKYSGDAGRVYTVGGSSGGIMTEALLGVYPDVFMAGVSLMGVPCGCWASSYNDVTGTGSTAQWSGPCAGGTVTHTGAQWGDLVRSYFPGYTGHRPRLQHWHGTADTTLNYKNMAEDIKEWTNLLGLSETPTGTEQNTPSSGTTHQYWKSSCGYTVYETFSMSGVGHAVPFNGSTVATYFGLSTAGGQDPETAACPGGGASGTGGATSTGGAKGTGGTSAASTGGTSSGGTTASSSTVKALGGTPATGGTQSTGTGNGGEQATGGRAVVGGSSSSGGRGSGGIFAAQTGGSPNTGGAIATGGSLTSTGGSSANGSIGGSVQTGGAVATTGGSSAAISGVGTGGTQGSNGTTSQGGDTSVAMTGPEGGNSAGSCSCVVAGRSGHSLPAATALLLATLATLRRKTHRSRGVKRDS